MDKKTEFVEKLSAQMVEWDTQIDLLTYKADSASAELKSEYGKEIAALQSLRNDAGLKLQGVSAASDDTWEELKGETEDIWAAISTSVHDAVLKIK
jgi:hypothetical protein